MPNILDKRFKYTPSSQSDISVRFKRIAREYAKMWEEAHAENKRRDERKTVVPMRAAR